MRRWLVFIVLCFSWMALYATHNRAGEITYRQISNLTFEITIITYTYTPSPADRPQLDISWGDGTTSVVQRAEKINLPGNISYNRYVTVHTYAAPSTYIISFEDPNRNAGVINIPNSVNVPFYVQSTLTINPFLGINNSPQLLNPPIDNACLNKIFIHNPGAYDIDGDSISYKLVNCRGEDGLEIAGYTLPSASNYISLDAVTGDFIWDSPKVAGEYNIAILIEEWRNGFKIGEITRDMQINVVTCNNNPPVIQNLQDVCVEAGTSLQVMVSAHDIDNDSITLTATGGPLQLTNNPAQFVQPAVGYGSVQSLFVWNTECSHVRKIPYQMSFKAIDNRAPINLADFETLNITVVCPPIQNLIATAIGNTIHLSWTKTICNNATKYYIYRRSGYYGFVHGNCETGVPSYTGYVKIAEINDINLTYYVDDNNGLGLFHGNDYCYMIIAVFSDGAESYASNEACASLKRDVPVITHVSIQSTSINSGSVFIGWAKPTELDTIQFPGPYKYEIYRSADAVSFIYVTTVNDWNITSFVENNVNTVTNQLYYRVDFFNTLNGNWNYIGSSHKASSVFLKTQPSDRAITLTWDAYVPWTNNQYEIYKYNSLLSTFELIGTSVVKSFVDHNLVNGVEYCYKIKSIGSYSLPDITNPLINFSQEKCEVPVDLTPPCSPLLQVSVNCDYAENRLRWTNPNNVCTDDVVGYNVYFATSADADLNFLLKRNSAIDTFLYHIPLATIAGCYAVTALDSNSNESTLSNIVCVDIDSCALYQLPNVFTPDNDGINDLFVPFPYNYVEKIDLIIYNRWGKIVFTTNDPNINWDGTDRNTKRKVSDGVYFYICKVYEIRLEGVVSRQLSGCVHVLSNR